MAPGDIGDQFSCPNQNGETDAKFALSILGAITLLMFQSERNISDEEASVWCLFLC